MLNEKQPSMSETITVTFGDQAENHVGMQKIGSAAKSGFTVEELKELQTTFVNAKFDVSYIDLDPGDVKGAEPAAVLIIKNWVDPEFANTLLEEQQKLKWDTKAKMYGRVVNKHARHNLCYGDTAQEPDYENGQGRIIPWSQLTSLSIVKAELSSTLGPKAKSLVAEGNRYYNPAKCGIGFHGDTERRIVIALRLGKTMPLHFQWFLKGQPVGKRFILNIDHGHIYIMSAKAVGTDWRTKNTPTLRHAAGADKYTTVK
jgi:hypothetical protein